MKKVIALLLALVLVAGMGACKKKAADATVDTVVPDPNAGLETVYVITEISDNTGNYEYKLAYDENHNLESISYSYEDENAKLHKVAHQYGFDASGRLLTNITVRDGKSQVTAFTYDSYGNKLESGWTYTYSQDGKITAAENTRIGQSETYTYDEDGRLVGKSEMYTDWTYTYDAKGNLIAMQTSYEWTDRYTYDEAGKLTKRVYGYDGVDPEWIESWEYNEDGKPGKLTINADGLNGGKDLVCQISYQKVYLPKEKAAVINAQQAYLLEQIPALDWK